MKLQQIYKSDIDRDINGVIKVAQDDERSIEQELREYIITKELKKHFNTFFDNYERSLDNPTDKIGVWISGFFGSGKSHFLKILSYLLSNDIVAGKHAIEYFADKFEDPMVYAQLERLTKVPTETILFNIDSKSSINKDSTAILRVFAKVFYKHCGFYGDDLKLAKLEQFVTKSGHIDEFKTNYLRIHGDTWENSRDAFAFFEDDIVETLIETLDMSETAARNWFNGTETADISIEQLVKEIKEYIDSKGKDFRLLFMVDEAGQYIGSDGSLMLNLQTIVEEIGSKCEGRVWVMVTSQEAIDSITKVTGDDFSKIQGRFNTRLSLSSSSVDEVIKKRILAKNDNAEALLKTIYNTNSAVLRNLFTFNDCVLDLKGYSSEDEYVETYPFIPYQFKLVQNVLAQIRKHGNSGKHLSGGERSMLSAFQEAAQVIENKDEYALAPFSLFYNTVHTFLESPIRRVIDRCQNAADNNDGIMPYDVEVLKLLYLIRYVDDVKANLDNITTLLVEDIRADKIVMRKTIQESLDRLVSQNYVSRNGDTYTFLTDDEQDIERDIFKNTNVDNAQIVQSIAGILFGDIYPSKKFKYGKYDFPFDQFIDETVIGQLSGSMRLRFLTVASDKYSNSDQAFIMESSVNNEAIFVLSDNYPYFTDLENAAKIRKYIKSRNVSQLPDAIQAIIRNKQTQAAAYEKTAKDLISSAISEAKVFVNGEKLDIKLTSAKDKIDSALKCLVDSVYSKLSYVTHNFDNDSEVLQILANQNKQMGFGGVISVENQQAVNEIEQFLIAQEVRLLPTSMGDIQRRYQAIPYGWREIDIAAAVASLISMQKVEIKYGGSSVQPSDKALPDYLRRKSEIDKARISRRVAISDSLMKKSREFIKEYFNVMDLPTDEDGVISYVLDNFSSEREQLQRLLDTQYSNNEYPGKEVVENGVKLCNDLLSQKKDNTALLSKMVEMSDELLDLNDDMVDINAFFKNQKDIFDRAKTVVDSFEYESEYLQAEKEITSTVSQITLILKMAKPYRRIAELPTYIQTFNEIYEELLNCKKDEVFADIQAAMSEIHQTANSTQMDIVDKADSALELKKKAVSEAKKLTSLDAMKSQISNIRQQYTKALVVVEEPNIDTVTVYRSSICYTAKLENEEDIEKYLEQIRENLKKQLDGHDVIHII